jgi:hypothetical protein
MRWHGKSDSIKSEKKHLIFAQRSNDGVRIAVQKTKEPKIAQQR